MTLEECYTKFHGDYEGTVERLMTEQRIRKYLTKFLDDGEFYTLEAGMTEFNDRKAFEAAHALKGVTLNLGMSALAKSSSDLTEALRYGRKPEVDGLFVKCKKDYKMTVDAIRKFLSEEA